MEDNKNKVDIIFGEHSANQAKHEHNKEMMPSNMASGIYELPDWVKDPVQLEKRKAEIAQEIAEEYGYNTNKGPGRDTGLFGNNTGGAGGYNFFGPDQTYIKYKQARDIKKNGGEFNKPLYSDYQSMLDTLDIDVLTNFTPQSLHNVQRSIRLNNEDTITEIELRRFLFWLNSENISAKDLTDDELAALHDKYTRKVRRLPIPVIVKRLIQHLHSIYIFKLQEAGLPEKEVEQIAKNSKIRTNMMMQHVKEHGPYCEMDNFNLFGFYFNKYGYDVSDRKYFEGNMKDPGTGEPYQKLYDRFKNLSGYDILDVYGSYLSEYRKQERDRSMGVEQDGIRTVPAPSHLKEEDITYDDVEIEDLM